MPAIVARASRTIRCAAAGKASRAPSPTGTSRRCHRPGGRVTDGRAPELRMSRPSNRRKLLAIPLALALASGAARAQPTPTPAASPVRPAVKDDEGEPRLSLPTEGDRDAWKRSGFRLGLGLTYGRLVGLEGAPGGRLLGATIRFGIRLD